MPVSEYVVVYGLTEKGGGTHGNEYKTRGGKEAKTAARALGSTLEEGTFIVIEAESNAEAVKTVQELFPGGITGKCFVVKKSLSEEL